MGLGSLNVVSLRFAREAADKWRSVLRDGLDPIRERERARREAARPDNSLHSMAASAFEARKAELRGDGKAGRWFSPLELHVLPKIGNYPVETISQQDIRDALAPIWHSKAATAQKAMDRLGIVLRHCAALGLDVDLQATDKAKALLGKQRHEVKNIPAMSWQEVPEFYSSLEDQTVTHLALRLLVLTGVRSSPIRFLRPDQIDGEIWTIPADMMKGRKGQVSDFRVPLSSEALATIKQALPHARHGYLFPSVRKGVISDATMSRLMERRGLQCRPHGFRATLRTWLAECTEAPHEVAETILGHTAGSKVVNTYRRTDYLEQRRALLERWAHHVAGQSSDVVQLVGA